MFYGTALGVYEAELNGTKIGSQMFAPGFSYYPRRVLHQTIRGYGAVAGRRKYADGLSRTGVVLRAFSLRKSDTDIRRAAGGCMDSGTGGCGRKPKDCLRRDGGGTGIPHEYAGEYDGEIYFADGRENVTGHASAYTKEAPFALEPTLTEVRLQDEMPVREATVHGDVTILDFGQNFAGIVEIDPSFEK